MKILGMGGFEFVIILIVILLIFGPKNLPKLGNAFGKTISNLRAGMNEGKKKEEEGELADDEPAASEPVAVLEAEAEDYTEAAQVQEPDQTDIAEAAEAAVAEAAAAVDEAFDEASGESSKKVKRVVRKKVATDSSEDTVE